MRQEVTKSISECDLAQEYIREVVFVKIRSRAHLLQLRKKRQSWEKRENRK